MAFTLDPQTGKITFGVVADGTHDAIARDIASEFNVSENFNDDFTTDKFTNMNGTRVSVNTGTEVIDWASSGATLYNDGEAVDMLGVNVDSTNWVLRFKLDINTHIEGTDGTANDLLVGLSDDNTSTGATNQNYLGWRITAQASVSTSKWSITDSLNQPAINTTDELIPITEPVAGVFYLEYKRTGTTTATATVFTDSSFSVVLNTVNTTIQNVTNLRYLKVMVSNFDGSGDSTFDGTIDNIQFWDGITVPVITSPNWRLRFELDITALSLSSGADLSMWVGMYDEDETSDSNNAQDGFHLGVFVDNILNRFIVGTPDNQAPRNSGIDKTMPTQPAVDTFFVELRRDTLSQTTVRFYTDNTYTTTIDSETQAGVSGSNNLKYLKIFNDVVANNANTMDGTIDNITFDDLTTLVVNEHEFEVNAILEQQLFTCGDKIIFQDDFTTNANWTQVNTGVSVTGGEIQGWGADATDRRVYHDLVTPLDDKGWKAEFEFEFSAFSGPTFGPAHDIFIMSDTQAPATTLQDYIGIRFGISELNRFALLAEANSQINTGVGVNTTDASINTRYFIRLERISPAQVKMSIFTGGFDVTPFGNTVSGAISTAITGLRFVSSSTNTIGGSARTLTGIIDNLDITNVCCSFEVDALLQTQGTCNQETVLFDQIAGNSSLWTSNTSQIVIDSGGSGIVEMNSLVGGGTTTSRRATRALDTSFPANSGIITIRQKVTKLASSTPTAIFMAIQNGTGDASLVDSSPRIYHAFGTGSPTGLFSHVSDGTNLVNTPQPQIVIGDGETQFVETIYNPFTQTLTLNSYSDSSFTTHVSGSPLQVDASIISMPSTLMDTVLSSNFTNSGAGRVMSADLDDYQVFTGGCPSFQVDALLQRTGDVLCGGVGGEVVEFTEDFTTNAGWTYSGSFPNKLLVDGVSFPNVLRMECFRSTAVDGSQQIVKDMGVTFNEGNVQSGDLVFEFDFLHILPCAGFAPAGSHFSLTEDSANIGDNRSTKPHLTLRTIAIVATNPGTTALEADYADGSGTIITTDPITLVNNTQYFPRITKFLNGTLQLEIYTDSGRTVHESGSPVSIDASVIATKELKFIQVASFASGGDGRRQRADIDNVSVTQSVGCPRIQVDALLQSQGDNGSCSPILSYTNNMSSATGWVSTDIVSPGFFRIQSGHILFDIQADATNDAISIDLADPTRLGANLPDSGGWRMRCTLRWTGLVTGDNNHLFIGLSDSSETTNWGAFVGTEDGIVIRFQGDVFGTPITPRWIPDFKDGNTLTEPIGRIDNLFTTGITYGIEIKRDSATQATTTLYTDGTFTTILRQDSFTIPSTITGLRYFKCSNWNFANVGEHVLTGEIDDLDVLSGGASGGNVACPEVDSILVSPNIFEFTVNALIQAQGENGNCPIPATETFYNRAKSTALAERLGEGVNSPFAGITRAGVRIAGGTHAGKAIEDYRALGLSRNNVGATGTIFATVRDENDVVIETSTNSILAETLPLSPSSSDITFTFANKVVLQDGYRVLIEFPNCIGCADSANTPNVFWFGTSTASPAGTERTFYGKTAIASAFYIETTTGFTQGGVLSFTTSPAEPANQRACASVDSVLRATFIEEFKVDAFVFILPVHNTFVNAILQAFDQEKDFFVDACLQSDLSVEFQVDACIETEGKRFFQVDAFVFILPVANAIVDAIVRYAQGTITSPTGGIPDLIIRVLRENPPSLKGTEIVDEIIKITSDPAEGFSFRGKTSRIKNWLNRLKLDNLILNDESSPDWYRTNWSLAPGI